MATPQDAPLDFRTALTQIERAVVDRISLALQERLPPVATLSELRNRAALDGIGTQYVSDRDLIYVQAEGVVFRWLDMATEPDDGLNFIQPIDSATPNGRWVRQTDQSLYAPRGYTNAVPLCQIPTGYARAVQLYEGEIGLDEALNRIFGRRPAILVRWRRTDKDQQGLSPGFYRARYTFQLICISYSPRSDQSALYGSDLPSEAALDPGLNQLLGDASDAVIGASDPATGYIHLVPGVDVAQPGADEILLEDLSERIFMGAAGLRITAYLQRYDYDAAPLTVIGLTTQHVNDHGQGDAAGEDCVLSGCEIPWPQTGLVGQPAAGSARIAGQVFAVSTSPQLFPASADTYRDLLPSGTFVYQSVANGGTPPPQVPSSLRVGLTSTSSTQIVFDQILCPTQLTFAGPDEIQP